MTMTLEELQGIARIEQDRQGGFAHHVNVCIAAGCLSCQSGQVREALEKEVARRGLENWCQVKGVGCLGLCTAGPLVAVEPGGILYQNVAVGDVGEILDALGGRPLPRGGARARAGRPTRADLACAGR